MGALPRGGRQRDPSAATARRPLQTPIPAKQDRGASRRSLLPQQSRRGRQLNAACRSADPEPDLAANRDANLGLVHRQLNLYRYAGTGHGRVVERWSR